MAGSDISPSAPLLVEAIPGFRAWRLDRDGGLGAAAWGSVVWKPGVNVATCRYDERHAAPVPGCTCGLYAFHTLHRQLAGEPVIGAVAAWGTMEIHADGFRAERACVLALARRDGMGRAELASLNRAAQRYRVPVVRRCELQSSVALQTAPPPASLMGFDVAGTLRWRAQHRGYVPADQVWVEPGSGVVTVGVSEHFRRLLGRAPAVGVAAGNRVERTDDLPVSSGRAAFEVPVPVAGTLLSVNDELGAAQTQAADPDGEGWLVRIEPSDWVRDASDLQWGLAGHAATTATAIRDGSRAVAHLAADARPLSRGVASWSDVRAALRADRSRARPAAFPSADALYDGPGITLGWALERDAAVRARLSRLDTSVTFVTRDPSARLTFDLRAGAGVLRCGATTPASELEVSCSAKDLVALLEGRLDLARDFHSGRLRVTGSPAAALSSLAVLTAWSRTVLRPLTPTSDGPRLRPAVRG